ncbi:hypothetical protein CERZMDRAFT_106686 [Cercospora zeae-maydis SCOH1-5]|uniref:Uncharacterized protein n=1 Tax=Cercospora zeae-maydis SCOH1-5 TaxID=717836 RepID=A0A6A6FC01_9PEZI|nr:hypothetical protein CERZMDRAFT_106686 [Cercospora zeae-maydis SCOH1-5]
MAHDNEDSFLSIDFRISFNFTAVSAPREATARNKKKLSSPATPAFPPAALNDVPFPDAREASLSPIAMEIQHDARLKYRKLREQLKRCEIVQTHETLPKAHFDRAAQMDRQSLAALEIATARLVKLASRPSGMTTSILAHQSPILCPVRDNSSCRGTPPYETSWTPTGTNFGIDSVPSHLPSSPTIDSDLLRAEYQGLLCSGDQSAGSPSKRVPSSPTFQQALGAKASRQSAYTNVESWLRTGTAGASSALFERSHSQDAQVDEVVGRLRTDAVDAKVASAVSGHIEEVSTGQAEEDLVIVRRADVSEEELYDAGHSSDSWSEDEDDGRVGGSSFGEGDVASPGLSEGIESWHDLGSDAGYI